MAQVSARFNWNAVTNAETYRVLHNGTELVATATPGYQEVLELSDGDHNFTLEAYNRDGDVVSETITRNFQEPRPLGPIEGFDVSFSIFPPDDSPLLYDITLAGTRSDAPAWVTDGTFRWAATPITNQTINVPADMSLSAAVQVEAARVVVAAGHTHNGTVSFGADHVDLVMPDDATIVGELALGNGFGWHRVTGGNVTGMYRVYGQPSRAHDIIIDNVHFTYNAGTSLGNLSGNFERVAVLNSTFEGFNGAPSSGWALYSDYTGPTPPTDLIVANVKITTTGGGQCVRLQGIDRYVFIDNASNMDGLGDNSFRGLANGRTWLSDLLVRDAWSIDPGSAGYAFSDLTATRIYAYRAFNNFFSDASGSAGTWNDSIVYTSNGPALSEVGISPFTGSNNPAALWDGSTVPSTSGYGADH